MGHVDKAPSGKWRARWQEDGQERSKSFTRKAEATAHLAEISVSMRRGEHVSSDRARATLRAAADTWLIGAMNLTEGGRDTYRRDLDRYILPALGDLPLGKVTDQKISAFLADELNNKKLAASSVQRHYATLHRLFEVAGLAVNPCTKVTPPPVPAGDMKFIDAAQVERLAAAISDRYAAWVELSVYGGLRWSENVGLRRRHINGNRVTVEEQLLRRKDNTWRRAEPKTKAGRRVITVPTFLAEMLEAHLEKWSLPGPDGLVFPNQRGGPMIGPSFTGNVFKPALARAGLDDMRIHDLRHTAVALAIAAGAHPKALQVRMGHSSIRVTLDRYGHLYPELDETVALGLGEIRAAAA